MYDVTAIGELLIDFTPIGKSANGNPRFEQNPGGAPANVLAALAKLGKKTCFIGKVGNDQFGKFLRDSLNEVNINTSGLIFSEKTNTTLAFVHLDENGERSFSFYRNPGADMTLSKEEIKSEIIDDSKIFHFGSISMTHEIVADATISAVQYAKGKNKIISFDPNLRENLWDDLSHAKEMIIQGLQLAEVVKVSEEEMEFITGESDLEKGSEIIQKSYNVPLIFVTLGEKGSFFRLNQKVGKVDGFKVNVKDTTGAGDAFFGGVLYKLLKVENYLELTKEELYEITRFANAVGALATTQIGGIPSMPTLSQVQEFIEGKK